MSKGTRWLTGRWTRTDPDPDDGVRVKPAQLEEAGLPAVKKVVQGLETKRMVKDRTQASTGLS